MFKIFGFFKAQMSESEGYLKCLFHESFAGSMLVE